MPLGRFAQRKQAALRCLRDTWLRLRIRPVAYLLSYTMAGRESIRRQGAG